MSKRVTKRDAEKVLIAVRRQFRAHLDPKRPDAGPQLRKDWDWFGGKPVPYAIIWEEGPFEWAATFDPFGFKPDVDEDLSALAGQPIRYPKGKPVPSSVYIEAQTSWAIGIYPAG